MFTYLGWNSISALGTASAGWRLQQFRDTQKHIHHSIPQSTVPAPPYYNLQYNLILPFHCWRATLPAPCTNLPFPLSHSCVATLIWWMVTFSFSSAFLHCWSNMSWRLVHSSFRGHMFYIWNTEYRSQRDIHAVVAINSRIWWGCNGLFVSCWHGLPAPCLHSSITLQKVCMKKSLKQHTFVIAGEVRQMEHWTLSGHAAS